MYCRVPPMILRSSVQEDSERLLQETAEALDAQLSLKGVQDIRAMLAAVDEGRSLHPLHLTAVASTLLATKAVEEQIQPQCGPASRSQLALLSAACICYCGTSAQEPLCCPSACRTVQVWATASCLQPPGEVMKMAENLGKERRPPIAQAWSSEASSRGHCGVAA